MKRMMVAMDGSAPSKRAAQRAAEMAPKLGLALSLVYVMDERTLLREWEIGGDEQEMHDFHRQQAREALERFSEAPELRGAERVCLFGTPAEALAEAAKADDVEMIVLGSRGRTLLSGMLIGSVAHRLIHLCQKPILIVH